jgi:DNA-binding response OmpR family regulator
MKVLLVEDERPLALAIIRILSEAGAKVAWTADGEKGYREALLTAYDLVILDILLPNKNGWQICEGLRRARKTMPILMLSALDETPDRVKGLEIGADDYLPKPFDREELVARVRALLRRDKVNRSLVTEVGDLVIDRKSRGVTRAGIAISLTRREYDLLEALASNEGKVLSRDTIQERVWQDDESFSNTVEVFISTLRKKIDVPFAKKLIHTVHGFGYVLKSE